MVSQNSIVSPLLGIFNDSFPPVMDGVSVLTKNYAYWLQKKTGHACVITPNCPESIDNESFPIYRYTSFPIPFRKPYRYGFPYVDRGFINRMYQQSFKLVHAHCPFSSGTVAMKIARRQGIPIVATFHSKYRSDFERVIPNKFVVDLIIKNIMKFYEMADEVWIPQADVEETIREYGFKGHVEVVDNGSDLHVDETKQVLRQQARKELGIPQDENVFLFVGQHIWEKNTAFLIKTLETLGDLPFKMFFIGTGYAAKEMKMMVNNSHISDKVTFVGRVVDRQLLTQYYAASDLFLFPSMYDNAPLVVREAAALQTPSLLLKNSTASGIIRDGFNGFLSYDLPEYFGISIKNIVRRKKRMQEVGHIASRTIVRPWDDIIDEVIDRYSTIISRKNLLSRKCV